MQNGAMDREQVVRALRAVESELSAAGVASVSLFGSTARGESAAADVDLAVQLTKSFSRGGFDYVGRLEDLEWHLSELLGCKVDVVEEPVRKPRFQQEIDRDRTLAF
jgi:predicted nucleotidyltransferase